MGISITSANRTPVKIDVTDYMKNGANQYAILEPLTSKEVV